MITGSLPGQEPAASDPTILTISFTFTLSTVWKTVWHCNAQPRDNGSGIKVTKHQKGRITQGRGEEEKGWVGGYSFYSKCLPAGCCGSVRAWHLLASHFQSMAKLFVPPNPNHFHRRMVCIVCVCVWKLCAHAYRAVLTLIINTEIPQVLQYTTVQQAMHIV